MGDRDGPDRIGAASRAPSRRAVLATLAALPPAFAAGVPCPARVLLPAPGNVTLVFTVAAGPEATAP